MNMKVKKLSKGGYYDELSSREIGDKSKEISEGMKIKNELGVKYENDKRALEQKYIEIENSSLSREDKIQVLNQLKAGIVELKRQYEENVEKEMEKYKEQQEMEIEKAEQAITELAEQEESIRNMKMEAGNIDTNAAADKAREEREKFERIKSENAQELALKMQQLEMMNRNMRKDNLSGH